MAKNRKKIDEITEEEILAGEKTVEEESRTHTGDEEDDGPKEPSEDVKEGVIADSQFPDGDEILTGEEKEIRRQQKARRQNEDQVERAKEDDEARLGKKRERSEQQETVPPEVAGPFNPETGEPIIPAGTPQPENRDEAPHGTQDSIPGPDAKLP